MKIIFALLALLTMTLGGEARAASLIKARNNMCLDVADGANRNGARLQLWNCDAGNKNQQFTLADGRLKAANGRCVDVKDGYRGNGGALQLWDCAQGNGNQAWEMAGQNIRLQGTNLCIDVVDGQFVAGGRLQTFQCDWRGTSNQGFAMAQAGGQAAQPRDNGGSSWMGHPMVSIERFGQLHPECAPFKDAFVAAGKDQNIHPVFLASICMIESSCRENVGTNPWGPYQFSDEGAWRQFGGGGNRQNIWDAAYAGARFYRWLLDGGRDIDAAMRYYNGPVENGGSPDYQRHVWSCSAGNSCW